MSKQLELIKRNGVYVCCVSGREFPPGDDPRRAARDSLFSAQMIKNDLFDRGLIGAHANYDEVRRVWQNG